MSDTLKTKHQTVRVGGKLKEIVTVEDEKGNVIDRIIAPLMVEFYARDFLQVMIGAALLAIPVAFTEETWDLGSTLPLRNVLGISFLSLIFIATFVHYNFYRSSFRGHTIEFCKRVLSIYLLSMLVVAIILTLIQRAPWQTDWLLAIKRVILVSFPASMSAAVADMIK